jgi:hypothetical protein
MCVVTLREYDSILQSHLECAFRGLMLSCSSCEDHPLAVIHHHPLWCHCHCRSAATSQHHYYHHHPTDTIITRCRYRSHFHPHNSLLSSSPALRSPGPSLSPDATTIITRYRSPFRYRTDHVPSRSIIPSLPPFTDHLALTRFLTALRCSASSAQPLTLLLFPPLSNVMQLWTMSCMKRYLVALGTVFA